jgi:hypothetical protein
VVPAVIYLACLSILTGSVIQGKGTARGYHAFALLLAVLVCGAILAVEAL